VRRGGTDGFGRLGSQAVEFTAHGPTFLPSLGVLADDAAIAVVAPSGAVSNDTVNAIEIVCPSRWSAGTSRSRSA